MIHLKPWARWCYQHGLKWPLIVLLFIMMPFISLAMGLVETLKYYVAMWNEIIELAKVKL